MLQEKEPVELETHQILPNIYIPCETSCVTPRETSPPLDNKAHEEKIFELKNPKTEEIEMVSNSQMPEQVVTSSQQQLGITGQNIFPKSTDIPHVLQACQNFDLRFQRELLKNAFALNLNSNSCLNQSISDEDAFRLACAKYMKSYHQNFRHQSHETEEQAAARRARNALRMRNYRQNLQVLETSEQAAERRAQNALRMRNYRRFKRELEPELAAERRAQNAERMRNYRKIIRELKPETAALLRAQNALRMRNYRKNKHKTESE